MQSIIRGQAAGTSAAASPTSLPLPLDTPSLPQTPGRLGQATSLNDCMHMKRRLVATTAANVLGVLRVGDRSANRHGIEAMRLAVLREHPEEADVLRDKPLNIYKSRRCERNCLTRTPS